ncbi:MAG: DUF3696 domain-containing protein, partial [Bacteroidetes bacterium]
LQARKDYPYLYKHVNIFYVDKNAPSQQQITTIKMNENGYLDKEFGTGFFDEADNIALQISLANYNANQVN